MTESNRDDRRDNRQGNRKRGKKEQQKPLALTFSTIQYQPTSRQLVVLVKASRGNKPVEAIDVQLLVPPTPVGSGKTDRNGQVTITADINNPPKTYQLIAETVGGEYAQATGAFIVPQPYELTDDTPVVSLTVESVEVSDAFVLVANVTGRRGMNSIQNAPVRIDYDTDGVNQMELVQLNGAGAASKRLSIPIDGRKKIVVSVRATLSGVPGSPTDTKVVTLTHEVKRVHHMPYLTRPLADEGMYEITLLTEEEDGTPVKGVLLTIASDSGSTDPESSATTDEHGRAKFTLECNPEAEQTTFWVDCPGLLDNAKVRLRRRFIPSWMSGRVPWIAAACSVLFALVLAVILANSTFKYVDSYLDTPASADIQHENLQNRRNAVERSAYQYLRFANPPADSAGDAVPTPARDLMAPKTMFWITMGFLGCCLATLVAISLWVYGQSRKYVDWAMNLLWGRRTGVADNLPNAFVRMLNRYLGQAAGSQAVGVAGGAVAATTNPVEAPRVGGGSHWKPVVMYGIADMILEPLIRKVIDVVRSRPNKKS